MGVTKMGNIVSRGGVEPTSLAFWGSAPRCHHNTHAYLSTQLLASEFSADYYTDLPEMVSLLLLTITYIQAVALDTHTQDRFNNHTTCSL